jgi:hypothetical protein
MTLGQFPALRHFKIQPLVSLKDHAIMLHFLKQLLSISSPNTTGSHIETLTIEITWTDLVEEWTDFGHGRDLFSSDAEWSALDEALTSGKYVSLHKVVWVFRLEKLGDKWEDEEFEKSSTLSCVNALFPMFKALLNTGRTLETNLELI